MSSINCTNHELKQCARKGQNEVDSCANCTSGTCITWLCVLQTSNQPLQFLFFNG